MRAGERFFGDAPDGARIGAVAVAAGEQLRQRERHFEPAQDLARYAGIEEYFESGAVSGGADRPFEPLAKGGGNASLVKLVQPGTEGAFADDQPEQASERRRPGDFSHVGDPGGDRRENVAARLRAALDLGDNGRDELQDAAADEMAAAVAGDAAHGAMRGENRHPCRRRHRLDGDFGERTARQLIRTGGDYRFL